MINKRVDRTGDGTHKNASIKSKVDENNNPSTHGDDHDHSGIWGWGKFGLINANVSTNLICFIHTDDKELTAEDRKYAKILYKRYD